MRQSDPHTEMAGIPIHLIKELRGVNLIYYLFKTKSGFHLKMEYGNDQFLTDWFPAEVNPFQLATQLFRMGVTPCTARDIFEDMCCSEISEKTIYKTE